MIDIKRNNTTILSVPISDKATQKKDLMTQDVISLDFVLSDYTELKKGDCIENSTYKLIADCVPTIQKETFGYYYNLEFHGIEKQIEDFLLMYTSQGLLEAEFNLTAKLSTHIDVVIASLARAGFGVFTYPASVANNETVELITYSNISIFEGLQLIAETYKLEWWFEGFTINVGVCELGNEVELIYDRELDSFDYNQSSEKMVTRLYAFGGTKNLPLNYRVETGAVDNIAEKRLRMRNDNGDVVDYVGMSGATSIIEGVQIFDDIFPNQKNLITHIESQTIPATEKTLETIIYKFRDNAGIVLVDADLLPGQTLIVSFTSGMLNGREFELILKKIDSTTWYEIKYTQEGNIVIPNGTLKPVVGDSYILTGFNPERVLSTLVPLAENELYHKALDYIDKIGHALVYTVRTRSIYCENNTIDLGIGQNVKLVINYDDIQKVVHSRIMGFEKNLQNKYDATYTIGDSKRYSRLAEIEGKIDTKSGDDIASLRSTIETTFKDGIITDAELATLSGQLAGLQREKKTIDKSYSEIYGYVLLVGESKVNLKTAKDDYDAKYETLTSTLNSVIYDRRITDTEKTEIDTLLNDYATGYSNYITAQELATNSITVNINSTLVDWKSDNSISPTEKLAIRQTMVRISTEKTTTLQVANKYLINTEDYEAKYATYYAVLDNYSQPTPEIIPIEGTEFADAELGYKTAKIDIDSAITEAQKTDINGKQPSGNYVLQELFDKMFEPIYDADGITLKAISVKKDFYSVGEISAFGLGSKGGSGGGSGVSVLSALNDVAINAISNGNVLIYNSALSKWENKPQSAIIPDLSPYAQKTYVDAAVSALVATAPSTLDTLNELATALGNDPNFATTITTLIGSKEGTIAAGTNAQYWRGDKTWQSLNTSVVTEGTNQYFTTARVLATALAGYSVGSNAALATSDTLLAAFGKIQAQINSKQASGSYQPLDADLTAIAALAGTSGFLKKTAADTWALDTSSYLLASANAVSATKLAASRNFSIAGGTGLTAAAVAFDGTANVALSLAGTLATANGGTGFTDAKNGIARKILGTFSTSATSYAITHSLGTDVVAQVINVTTKEVVECDIIMTDANTVTFAFNSAPAVNAYRYIIIG